MKIHIKEGNYTLEDIANIWEDARRQHYVSENKIIWETDNMMMCNGVEIGYAIPKLETSEYKYEHDTQYNLQTIIPKLAEAMGTNIAKEDILDTDISAWYVYWDIKDQTWETTCIYTDIARKIFIDKEDAEKCALLLNTFFDYYNKNNRRGKPMIFGILEKKEA